MDKIHSDKNPKTLNSQEDLEVLELYSQNNDYAKPLLKKKLLAYLEELDVEKDKTRTMHSLLHKSK